MIYDCIVIGGGIAGLQASIQLGRYLRSVLIIDAGEGRASLCNQYNNILGYPEGVKGSYLLERGKKQAEQLGVKQRHAVVSHVYKSYDDFIIETAQGESFVSRTLLFATGIKQNIPAIEGIRECLGLSLYVCPDCDGYETVGKKTMVLGSGNIGARMALAVRYWCNHVTFVNHDGAEISLEAQGELHEARIFVQQVSIKRVIHKNGLVTGMETEDGIQLETEKVFLGFGGNDVQTKLADKLGVMLDENGHLFVDPRTKMTNIEGVWAAGDIVNHSQFVTTAMGDGIQAAVWMQKWLRRHLF
ncbi:NAD(P)/FAD-dependent oxidoreductase [Halobacillus litoralis]|uniref:NAD(P)/FAD-dependent oxidoreductase n=1 Tax=Halobacillus litoralis TaxID=45668 RepID=UPI001CFE71FE|nr:NAD(P)/FAD-dependent oxidoreductase [Halobacillus litoralis]